MKRRMEEDITESMRRLELTVKRPKTVAHRSLKQRTALQAELGKEDPIPKRIKADSHSVLGEFKIDMDTGYLLWN